MKNLVAVAVVIIALVLTGSVSAAPKEPVTVVFWNIWGGTRAPLLRQILDKFEATHPGIKIENVTLDGSTDTQKMLTAVAGGTVPDIYMTHTNDLSMWANLKAFKPLNDYVKRDNLDLQKIFYPGALQGSTFSGQVIQLPFKFTSTMMIWYNKDLFKGAGLDPERPPKTWKELEAAAKALTKKRGNVIEQAGLNICANCVKGPEDPFNEWLGRNGGSILNAEGTEVTFDGPRGIETMQWMKSFMENTVGGFDKFATQFGVDWPENRPAFYSGKLGMIMDGPWALDIYRKEAPHIVNKLGVFLIPINGDNPDAKQQYTAYGVPGYAIPVGAKNADAAWEVLKFIGMDGGCEFFKRQNRTDSPLPTCLDEQAKKSNPFFDTFVAAMNSVKVVNGPPPYNQIQLRFKEMEEAVLMGKETPEAGVKKAAEDCRAILKRK